MRFENSVVINQPVAKVFEFVTDVKNNPKWQTNILELELTSNGTFGSGSTYRCVNLFMGQRIETEGLITDFVREKRCSIRITSGAASGESRFLFEPLDADTTRFTTSGDLDLRVFKFAKMIVRHKITHQLEKDMLRLKEVLEDGSKPASDCETWSYPHVAE